MCDKNNDEKCNLKNISEYDIKVNQIKITNMYNGTYFVCVVYGIFAVAILLGSYLSDSIREIFFEKFMLFTIIFIVGSIVIIGILFYYVTNYKIKKTKHLNMYDTYSCPDYWTLVTLDDNNVYKNFDSNVSPNYFKYKCVLNQNIFDKYDNYANIDVNSKQTAYNLTNNLLNTTNLDSSTNGDYFNTATKNKLENNIDLNIGHLYKNINDINIFPLSNTSNYFAYSRPGAKLKEDDLLKIKNAIINTSLRMNNYSYNDTSNTYSNINFNSYNENNDPYITWNNKKDLPTAISTNYTSGANSYKIDGTNFYENFYVYKWTYNNINNSTYQNLFNSDITTPQAFSVYAGKDRIKINNDVPTLKIGEIIKENNNIYFKAIPHLSTTNTNMLFNFVAPDGNNNKIIFSYIDTAKKYDGVSAPDTDYKLTALQRGPQIIIDNGYGRPPIITPEQISNNTLNIPVVCDTVYPAYLASVEDIDAYGADNTIRCSYAKLCGYSWSDMGCN